MIKLLKLYFRALLHPSEGWRFVTVKDDAGTYLVGWVKDINGLFSSKEGGGK